MALIWARLHVVALLTPTQGRNAKQPVGQKRQRRHRFEERPGGRLMCTRAPRRSTSLAAVRLSDGGGHAGGLWANGLI